MKYVAFAEASKGNLLPGGVKFWESSRQDTRAAAGEILSAYLDGVPADRIDRADVRAVIVNPTWRLVWAPEGKEIAIVKARTIRAAKRKAPQPYRKYLGEIYAEQIH